MSGCGGPALAAAGRRVCCGCCGAHRSGRPSARHTRRRAPTSLVPWGGRSRSARRAARPASCGRRARPSASSTRAQGARCTHRRHDAAALSATPDSRRIQGRAARHCRVGRTGPKPHRCNLNLSERSRCEGPMQQDTAGRYRQETWRPGRGRRQLGLYSMQQVPAWQPCMHTCGARTNANRQLSPHVTTLSHTTDQHRNHMHRPNMHHTPNV